MIGHFDEVCKQKNLKVNRDKSNVVAWGGRISERSQSGREVNWRCFEV